MQITEWEVENYKSIKHGQFDLGDLTVLIGKNNSGKSNVVDSLKDYRFFIQNNRFPNFGKRVYGKDNTKEIKFRIKFRLNELEKENLIQVLQYSHRYNLSDEEAERVLNSEEFKIFEHEVVFSGSGDQIQKFKTNYGSGMVELYRDDSGNAESLQLNHLPDKRDYAGGGHNINLLRHQGIDLTENWSFLNPKRQVSPKLSPDHSTELNPDAGNIEQVFDTIYRNDKEKYDRISEKYVEIMEGVENIRTEFLENNDVTSFVEEEVFPEGFTLDEISSGSQEILTLITKVVLAEENLNLLVVEEPEIHLHPKAQRKIFDLMDEVTEKRPQIIVTTHSAEFIDKSDLENIVLVSRNGSTQLRSAESGDIDEHLTTLGYDKSDLLQSSGVVFVEGRSDKSIFEILSKKMGESLIETGIELVPRGEPGETEQEIIDVLDRLSIPYLYVLDGHGEDPVEREEELREELGVSPDKIKVLSKYGIESYLKDVPEAVADAFDLDSDYVREYLDENTTEDNEKDALKQLYDEEYGQTYNKENHGSMIALKIGPDEIPAELEETIRDMIELAED